MITNYIKIEIEIECDVCKWLYMRTGIGIKRCEMVLQHKTEHKACYVHLWHYKISLY